MSENRQIISVRCGIVIGARQKMTSSELIYFYPRLLSAESNRSQYRQEAVTLKAGHSYQILVSASRHEDNDPYYKQVEMVRSGLNFDSRDIIMRVTCTEPEENTLLPVTYRSTTDKNGVEKNLPSISEGALCISRKTVLSDKHTFTLTVPDQCPRSKATIFVEYCKTKRPPSGSWLFATKITVLLEGTYNVDDDILMKPSNMTLARSCSPHVVMLYVSQQTSKELSIRGWNRIANHLTINVSDWEPVDPVDELAKAEPSPKLINTIHHKMEKTYKDLQIWINNLLQIHRGNLSIAISQNKRLDIPWEMLPLDHKNYLGGQVAVARWRKEQYNNLIIEEREHTGTVLAHIDERELAIKPADRAALDLLQREEYARLEELIEELRKLLEDEDSLDSIGLIYLSGKGNNGTVIHSQHDPMQQIEAHQLVELKRRSGPRPIMFININASAKIDTEDGLLELSLDHLADGYIGLRGHVDKECASGIAEHLLKVAGTRPDGIYIAEELRQLRAKATELRRSEYSAFLHTFMYVYYGNPLDKLRLISIQDQEQQDQEQ